MAVLQYSPLFTDQITFIDCLLLSKAQTFHIHILLLPGGRWGWEAEDRRCIPETPNKLKHLCVGDTPVLAMVLKLPCTHFPLPILLPCLPSPSAVHSPAHPPQANQGDRPKNLCSSPHRAHCIITAIASSSLLSVGPQGEQRAGPKLMVSAWSPAQPQHMGHCGWDCQSHCCCCLDEVSKGDQWASDGFQHVRAIVTQSTLKSLMGLGQCNAPGVWSLQSP